MIKRQTARYTRDADRFGEDNSLPAHILETLDLPVISKDLSGRVTTWNPAAEHMFGYTAEEMIGQPIFRIIPEERRAEEEQILARLRNSEKIQDLETVRMTKEGRRLEVSVTISPIRDEQGEIIGASKLIRDITERKRTEAALRESEERFRQLSENIPQLAWMANADGSIFWYNRRWFEYTGATLKQMQGWGWQKIHHPEHVRRVTERIKAAFNTGQPWEDTFPLRGRNGQYRWFLSRAFPIRESGGRITRWFGTNTDITDLLETQTALRNAQEQLQQHAANLSQTVAARTATLREAIEELQAFSYTVAHDMRAPLRAMQSFAAILAEEHAHELSPDAQGLLGRIAASANRLDLLTQDVLNYSKVARADLPLEPIDIRNLLEEIVGTYPNLRPEAADICIPPALPSVIGNRATLTQVFSNLLGNAVKFVAPGVRPRVVIRAEAKDPSKSDLVRIWFEDNGIGIAPSEAKNLFQMFYRAHGHSKYEGTGMGLAIVRKAVERMGGRVGFQSRPDEGSSFWLELPAAP